MRRRLDAELVRRGLARSREHAVELVGSGRVRVNGQQAHKVATQVETGAALLVIEPAPADSWVGRGAGKLDGALDALESRGLPVAVKGTVCMDAGASTGGFTQILLRRGASLVHAVDVGYGQLAWELRSDERVAVLERTNVRDLGPGDLDPAPDLVVADLSFISLALVLPALIAAARPQARLLLMVKPQFEVGRHNVGTGGVVRDPALRRDAVLSVVDTARRHGRVLLGATASPLPGPSGNVEYFVLLAPPDDPAAVVHDEAHRRAADEAEVARAVADGPTGDSSEEDLRADEAPPTAETPPAAEAPPAAETPPVAETRPTAEAPPVDVVRPVAEEQPVAVVPPPDRDRVVDLEALLSIYHRAQKP